MKLTELQLDVLAELCNMGLGTAAASLSEMVASEVLLSVPRVEFVPRADAVRRLGVGRESVLKGVRQHFAGEVGGSALLLFPDEHSLRIQLALAIDLDDRPVAAGTVIEDLRPTARARHPVKPAPRLRYGRWPHFDLAAAEAGLPETTDADADLSSLAQALAPEITSGQEP